MKRVMQFSIEPYSGDLTDYIAIVKHYATQNTNAFSWKSGREFVWDGPVFKPEHEYLTNEGYPLGTTCWFVRVEWGWREFVCADTFEEAVIKAHEFIVSKQGQIVEDW